MALIQRLINKIRRRPAAPPPPVIDTVWGPVSESIRFQAAINMRLDSSLRDQVEAMVTREMGGDVEKGKAEMRRRYPEAFVE